MQYSYYPGCSLHSTGLSYDKSVRAVFEALGADLIEQFDERDKHLVVELNGRCVFPPKWPEVSVNAGDRVETRKVALLK